jgi:hypothetical protein
VAVGACTEPRNCTISISSPFVAIVIGPSLERSSGLLGALLGGQTRFPCSEGGRPVASVGERPPGDLRIQDLRIQY